MPAKRIITDILVRPKLLGLVAGILLLFLASAGLYFNPVAFWRAYLLAYAFWLQLGLGCLGMVMLHHLVGGRWSALIRRVMETGAMTLPLPALLFLPILFGVGTLYPWANPDHVLHSELLQQKTSYLNVPFFVLRAALYFAVWLGLAYFLNRWSLEQDRTGAPALAWRMHRLSAGGMILYVLTTTFAAYDWLMSLEPEWFSSIYGLLLLSGQASAGVAVAIIGLRFLSVHAPTPQAWLQPLNDLGNFLLAFIMVWAYLAFSQFLIIWSANIPEEAVWYVNRSQGGWLQAGIFLIALHFVFPFFLLLSRRLKRHVHWLTVLAFIILGARFIDLYWLIVPAFYPEGIALHWLDVALPLAMGLAWIAMFSRQWTGKAPIPGHDPHLQAEASLTAATAPPAHYTDVAK